MENKVRNTFRAFKKHKIHDPLKDVGQADLTADVDFDYLKRKSGPEVTTHGPISQRQFLRETGIEIRANMLLEKNPRIKDDITKSLDLLISPNEMGENGPASVLQNSNALGMRNMEHLECPRVVPRSAVAAVLPHRPSGLQKTSNKADQQP